MIIKNRLKSVNYCILESLYYRENLTSSDKGRFEAQKRGLEGELVFDRLIKDAQVPGLVICDLLLSTRDTHYQIDALYITDGHINIYEIKNYTGPYTFKDGFIYSESGYAVQDPIAQVKRKQSYLHNLLLNMGHLVELSYYVVFINTDFYLYSLPETAQVIFSGQLHSHFAKLSRGHKKASAKTLVLTDKLITLHEQDYRPSNLPDYTFDQIKKGIYCPKCKGFTYKTTRQFRICSNCHFKEKSAHAIERTLKEFRLLFPDEKLTKMLANEWCGLEWSSNRIKSVLVQNFNLHRTGRSSYYT